MHSTCHKPAGIAAAADLLCHGNFNGRANRSIARHRQHAGMASARMDSVSIKRGTEYRRPVILYKALAYGPVSVASPAASSFAVFLVLLNALAGEPWTYYQALAVVMVFVGVVMLSAKSDSNTSETSSPHHYSKKWMRRTSLLATGAALTISFRMFFAQEATAELGAVSALYLNRLFALITCSLALLITPVVQRTQNNPASASPAPPTKWPTGTIVWFVLLQGVLEMAAFAAFLYGSEGDGRVAATIGFSTFAAATTLIAWVALKEPIGWWRGVWIVFISLGVMVASVG